MFSVGYREKMKPDGIINISGNYKTEAAALKHAAAFHSNSNQGMLYDVFLLRPYMKVVPKEVPTFTEPVEFDIDGKMR